MQKQIQKFHLAMLGVLLLIPFSTGADEQRGTAEQAQELVANVIAYYDENGRDAAFAAIEDKQGAFVNYDLYIFVYGPGRTVVAHGADPSLNGTLIDTLIDIQGRPFGAALMDGVYG